MVGKTKFIATLFFVGMVASFFGARTAKADAYQTCQPGVDCTLGEYIFDDSYVPVTIDVCTITVTDPDGNVVANQVHTTFGGADGWHSYTFNGTAPEGLYRAIMCCTFDAEKSCKDKSFLLQTPNTVAADPNAASKADVANLSAKIDDSTKSINHNVDDSRKGIKSELQSSTNSLKSKIGGIGGAIADLWAKIVHFFGG